MIERHNNKFFDELMASVKEADILRKEEIIKEQQALIVKLESQLKEAKIVINYLINSKV